MRASYLRFCRSCTGSYSYFLRQRSTGLAALVALTGILATPVCDAAAAELEEIVVTASLRPAPASELPVSTTVLDSATLRAAGLQHFGDVLGLVPNLNWAGGTSRPRFFQLRGIGELEQYQGAPNPSVGFLIDEIDFSGVGMPATLFDVEQIEVLRGPQGTRYGANALAGLIKLNTHDPEPVLSLTTQAMAGEDGLWGAGLQTGGALAAGGADSAWRLVAQRLASDGFRHNAFFGRDDTNERRETTARGKLRFDVSDAWRIDMTAMHVDLDNGYDVFTPDNSLTTNSDRPGQDAQRSFGGSVVASGDVGGARLVSTSAVAESDIDYSFDGDWGNDAYWGEFAPYDYYTSFERRRRTLSQDLRLVSDATATDAGFGWVAGLYTLKLDEDGLQRDEFAGEPLRQPLSSAYEATNVAAYGELEWRLGETIVLAAGLRTETRSADYEDSDGARFAPDDTMLGGHLSLRGEPAPAASWYVTASRGYKASGFNIGQLVPQDRRSFAPEYLWNLEAGLRLAAPKANLAGELSLFHMWRDDQQVATSFQVDPGDPLSYIFFTDNAASGRNYGLEARARLASHGDAPRAGNARIAAHGIHRLPERGPQPRWTRPGARTVLAVLPRVGMARTARPHGACGHGGQRRVLLRRESRSALRAANRRQSQGGLVGSELVDVRLGPQHIRRVLRRAGVLFRPRAARLREQALRAARRPAPVRRNGRVAPALIATKLTKLSKEPRMRIAVEISLYPLDADYVPPIKDFIERLAARPGLTVATNAMSTQVAGEHEQVFAALSGETARTFASAGRSVFVMKVLGGGAGSPE